MSECAENGREWLRRMVALLFSLSLCAEKASTRSWLVRRYVLSILRKGEAAAFQSVANAAREFGRPHPACAIVAASEWMHSDHGNGADEALLLARRLRALATALEHLLAMAEQLAETACCLETPGAEISCSGNTFDLRQGAWAKSALHRTAIRAPPASVASPI